MFKLSNIAGLFIALSLGLGNTPSYGMNEYTTQEIKNIEKTGKESEKSNLERKTSANAFNIKGPGKPWEVFDHTGRFKKPPKVLSEKIGEYQKSLAKGSFEATHLWAAYFNKTDVINLGKLLENKKYKDYFFEYGKINPLQYDRAREKIDKFIFAVGNSASNNSLLLRFLIPVFEAYAFYDHNEPIFNATAMKYLGRIYYLLGKLEKDEIIQDELFDEAAQWMGMGLLLNYCSVIESPLTRRKTEYKNIEEKLELLEGNALPDGSDTSFDYEIASKRNNHYYALYVNTTYKIKLENKYISNMIKDELKNSSDPWGSLPYRLGKVPSVYARAGDYLQENFQSLIGRLLATYFVTRSIDRLNELVKKMGELEDDIKNSVLENLGFDAKIEEKIADLDKNRHHLLCHVGSQLVCIGEYERSLSYFEASKVFDAKAYRIWSKNSIIKQGPHKLDMKTLYDEICELESELARGVRLEIMKNVTIVFIHISIFQTLHKMNFIEDQLLIEKLMWHVEHAMFYSQVLPEEYLVDHMLFQPYLSYLEVIKKLDKKDKKHLNGYKKIAGWRNRGIFEQITLDDFREAEDLLLQKEIQVGSDESEDFRESTVQEKILPKYEKQTSNIEIFEYKKIEKPKKIEPSKGESHQKKIEKMLSNVDAKVLKTYKITNIREDLYLLAKKDLSDIESLYLEFSNSAEMRKNFVQVINDIKIYGPEPKGKGQPEKIRNSTMHSRRITKGARVVYYLDEKGNIIIAGLFKDSQHDKYIKFIN